MCVCVDWRCWRRGWGCRAPPRRSSRGRTPGTRGRSRCWPRATPSRCTPGGACNPAQHTTHCLHNIKIYILQATYIDKNSVNIICAVVALEWRDVRPEVVRWKYLLSIKYFCRQYFLDSRGTISTFLFLSLLSARWPAAQSPMVKRGVWLQISCGGLG